MEINYNVTGQDRKALVEAVSDILGIQSKYCGAPGFAYQIGDYTVSRDGTLEGPDNISLRAWLAEKGFSADEPEFEDLDMTEEEELGLGQSRRDPQGEDGMQESDCPEPDSLTIEVPLAGFTPEKLTNLINLVNAKAPLLKAALGAKDLPVQQTNETLLFPWFGAELDSDHVLAYATLIAKICDAAKQKARVTAKERDFTNPKYAMRCWLLSLGFIGPKYKDARRVILERLEGNGSWLNGKKAEAASGSAENEVVNMA